MSNFSPCFCTVFIKLTILPLITTLVFVELHSKPTEHFESLSGPSSLQYEVLKFFLYVSKKFLRTLYWGLIDLSNFNYSSISWLNNTSSVTSLINGNCFNFLFILVVDKPLGFVDKPTIFRNLYCFFLRV